jgi:hypothetical protein
MTDRDDAMRRLIECIARGHSMRGAERECDVSHSAVALWMKRSRVRDNRYVLDGRFFHEHIDEARAQAATLERQIARRGASDFERTAQPEPVEFDPAEMEPNAHKVELLDAAPPGVNANDPLLRHPRATWSVNSDLRPQLADAVESGTLAGRIDGGGYGRQAPPQDATRTTVATRRYSFAERVKTGPLTVHIIKR